jgi:hypothetical protein
MTAAVSRWATGADHPLIDGYARFCHDVGLADRAVRDRLRLARAFLDEHHDLDAWMARPTRARLADLQRIKAWSLVSWAGLTGRVHLDLDLLAAKDLGGMSAAVGQLWPIQLEGLWEVARRLGWSYYWSRSVIDQFVPAVVAWSSTPIDQLSGEGLDAFEEALGDVTSASATTRKQWHGRLFGLRQLLFECGQIDQPPTRGPRGATIEDRLSSVPAAEIRDAVARYVTARSAVLSRSSVQGLVNDLIPFGMFLSEHHPDWRASPSSSAATSRSSWCGTAPGPGGDASPGTGRCRPRWAHATVLAVRNFLDDITLWGWADRPARRLVFAADVPRLPRPLPRALAPDADAALMDAVARLDDPFARATLMLVRRAGLRLGECLDLELGCVVDYGPTGIWLRVPLGKLGTDRCALSTPPPSPPSMPGPAGAASSVPIPIPAPAPPPTSSSPSTAVGSRPGGSARLCVSPPPTPVSPARTASRSMSPRTSSGTPTPPSWPTPG